MQLKTADEIRREYNKFFSSTFERVLGYGGEIPNVISSMRPTEFLDPITWFQRLRDNPNLIGRQSGNRSLGYIVRDNYLFMKRMDKSMRYLEDDWDTSSLILEDIVRPDHLGSRLYWIEKDKTLADYNLLDIQKSDAAEIALKQSRVLGNWIRLKEKLAPDIHQALFYQQPDDVETPTSFLTHQLESDLIDI